LGSQKLEKNLSQESNERGALFGGPVPGQF